MMISSGLTTQISQENPVIFIGAGPGHPDLITVAGQRALAQADLIVYAGSLVSPDMLSWAKEGAELVDSAGLDLEQIVTHMVMAHQAGRRVVRLHSGDPSLYGAVWEQFQALRQKGVPYQVIPGVTAALASASVLGLEFTIPEISQTLILTRAAGRTPVPESEALAGLAAHRSSLAIYLSAEKASDVAQALMATWGPEAPLVVVYRATWPDQQVLWTTVGELVADLAAAGIHRQALILVGPAVEALRTGQAGHQSKLYDPEFQHGFREAKPRP